MNWLCLFVAKSDDSSAVFVCVSVLCVYVCGVCVYLCVYVCVANAVCFQVDAYTTGRSLCKRRVTVRGVSLFDLEISKLR
jgi:hypothetical protein